MSISYGLGLSLSTYKTKNIITFGEYKVKDFFDLLKSKVFRNLTKERNIILALKDTFLFSYKILDDKYFLYRIVEEGLKKLENKKIRLDYCEEVSISREEDIVVPRKPTIIYVDESILPKFVYIMHRLHARILKKLFSVGPKEIVVKDVDIIIRNKTLFNYVVLGFKIGLEPIFALALFYNSKYEKNMGFFIDYVKFVNDLAVQTSKIFDILENRKVDKATLLEIAKDIEKIRNENLL